MYRCTDCDCIFEEPIVQKFSYEEFYGVASMFDTSTPLEIKVCPNCNSMKIRYFGTGTQKLEEEVKKIIESGSLLAQQTLSRNYFKKDGFYKQLVLHYATLLKYIGILIPNPTPGKSLSTSHISKRYFQAMDFVDKMNLQTILVEWA